MSTDVMAAATPSPPKNDLAEQARRNAQRRKTWLRVAQICVAALLLVPWEVGARYGVIDEFFYGSPSGIVERLIDWIENGTAFGPYWYQIWVTLEEAALGFFFGSAIGLFLGVLLGQNRFIADVLDPYIKAINALPRIVLGSLFVIWFGIGTTPKVILAAVLVFFAVFFNAFQGVRSVDRNLIANARILGASPWQITRHVIVPSATTWIIASLHIALGLAIVGAIVGEVLVAQHGLGLVIATSQGTFDANGVFAAMFTIGLIVLIAEALVERLERRLLAWRPQSESGGGRGL